MLCFSFLLCIVMLIYLPFSMRNGDLLDAYVALSSVAARSTGPRMDPSLRYIGYSNMPSGLFAQ